MVFLHQQAVLADAPPPARQVGSAPSSFAAAGVNAFKGIPAHLGTVRDAWSPSGQAADAEQATIFNIQDAHAYEGAQTAIASILDTLVRNYELKVVAVEGSSGYIDTAILRTYPDRVARDQTARRLVHEGRMSAAELYAITSGSNVALYGIDDEPLYRQNLSEFRRTYAHSRTVAREVAASLSVLRAVADKAYPAKLKALDAACDAYRAGTVPFRTLWTAVRALAAPDLSSYRNLAALAALVEDEKKIDFAKANSEREALIPLLSGKMPQDELRRFLDDLVMYRRGKVTPGEFHASLSARAAAYGIDFAAYPNLSRYTPYCIAYESIDLAGIGEELDRLTASIREGLFENDDQRLLYRYIHLLTSIDGLFNMQLTNGGFDSFLACREGLTAAGLEEGVGRLARKYGVDAGAPADLTIVFDALPDAVAFFRTAERRNRAMIDNTIKRMQAEGRRVAALVTGGYHTKGITDLLRRRETSYVVIVPKFDPSRGERPYVTILTNRQEPYRGLLRTGDFHIAARDYFSRTTGMTEAEQFAAYERDMKACLAITLGRIPEAAARDRAARIVVAQWLAAYRADYEAYREARTRGVLTDYEKPVPEAMERYFLLWAGLPGGAPAAADLMALPVERPRAVTRERYNRSDLVQEQYDRMLTNWRAEVMISELRRLLMPRGGPRDFIPGFIEAMPAEHLRRASTGRILAETAYAHLFSVRCRTLAREGRYAFTLYNPDDAGHTELMIYGAHAPALIHSITDVLNEVAGEELVVSIDSQWNFVTDGQAVFVFELRNKRTGLALTERDMSQVRAACEQIYPLQSEYVDIALWLREHGERDLAEGIARIAARIAEGTPLELDVPSVKGEDVMFLTVRKATSFVDYRTIIDEDIWTEQDTPRQRQAKIFAQREQMETAVAALLKQHEGDGALVAVIERAALGAYRILEVQGKSAVFSFNAALKEYIASREGAGDAAFLAAFNAQMESYTYLADDAAVAKETEAFRSVVASLRASVDLMAEQARNSGDDEAASAAEVPWLAVKYELPEIERFIAASRRKAYIKIHEKVSEYGQIASMVMGQIAEIKADPSQSDEQKKAHIKILEGTIDIYAIWAEFLRSMYNYGHPLPMLGRYIEEEKVESLAAIEEVVASLPPAIRESADGFLAGLGGRVVDALRPGGPTASHLVHEFAVQCGIERPDQADAAKYVSALFTSILEGRRIPAFAEEDQPNTFYVTDVMDQLHAFRLVEKNPQVAAIGASDAGNSRSHWVITLEGMLVPGREQPIAVIPGVGELRGLKTGDVIVLDAERHKLVVNPRCNAQVMAYYDEKQARRAALREAYREHMREPAVTADGCEVTFLSDIPRVAPDAAMTQGLGAAGIGLIRMENMYMRKEEPTEEDIYQEALRAAAEVSGPVTFRTLDMEKDKLVDMECIKHAVAYLPNDGVYTGVLFYFEDPKGREIFRTQLRALIRAHADAPDHNIRVTIPMVENEDQAEKISALVRSITGELVAEGLIPAAPAAPMQFGAMIETPAACMSVEAILEQGFFRYISIGTNDLAKRSVSEAYERDDQRLETHYHELSPMFKRFVEMALDGVNRYNAACLDDDRVKVCVCGEWAKSRKFVFYILGLMKKYPAVRIDVVSSSYRIGELKEYVRHVSQQECLTNLMPGQVNERLAALAEIVKDRIDEDRGVRERMCHRFIGGQAGRNQPILLSHLKRLAGVEAALAVIGVVLLQCVSHPAPFVTIAMAAGISFALFMIHAVTAWEISAACRSLGVRLTGPDGKELFVSRFNTLVKMVQHLYVDPAHPTDLTYTPTVDVSHYVRLIDLIGKRGLGGRFARAFIMLHEQAHAGGSGEVAAYLFPFWGAWRMVRNRQEIVRDVIASLTTHTDLSNVAMNTMIGSDPATIMLLKRELYRLTRLSASPAVAARAQLFLGLLVSRKHIQPTVSRSTRAKRAMKIIRDSMRRSMPAPSADLRIPRELYFQDLVISSPIRVDLCHGGASDLYVMTSELSGRAINIAYDLDGTPPIRVTVRRIPEPVIRIRSVDLTAEKTFTGLRELTAYEDHDDALRLFKAAFIVTGIINPADTRPLADILRELGGGIELVAESDVPRGSGLGASSILEACVVEGLYRISGQRRTKNEIVDAVLYLEQMLDIGGGWQDPIGGIYGGIKFIYSPTGTPSPAPEELPVSESFKKKLEERCVLYFTGTSHFAGDILEKLVIDFISRSEKEYDSRMRLMKLDMDIRRAVESEDIDALAALLTAFWTEWKVLVPETTNAKIEQLFAGAAPMVSGGKLCGAGAGGFALFIAKEGKAQELKEWLAAEGKRTGGRVYEGTINGYGMRVETQPAHAAADLVCGIPDGVMKPEAVESLSALVASRFPHRKVVFVPLATGRPDDAVLAAAMKDLGASSAIILNISYADAVSALTRHPALWETAEAGQAYEGVIVTGQAASPADREALRDLVSAATKALPLVTPLSVEQLRSLQELLEQRSRDIGSLVAHRASGALKTYVSSGRRAVSITTQDILDSQMLYALRDKIRARRAQYGLTADGEDPVRELVLITNAGMTPDDARKYIEAHGLAGLVEAVFSDTIAARVADLTHNQAAVKVGIRSCEGEIRRYAELLGPLTDQAVKLELGKIGDTYLDTNSYEVLLELLAQDGEWHTIPGVSRNDEKDVFRYIPKALPYNYTKEIAAHREALVLIMSAA